MTEQWQRIGYGDLRNASVEGPDVVFRFANGDSIRLARDRLGISESADLRVDPEEPTGVLVDDPGKEPRRIPWETIRAIDDPLFAQHRREQERDEARRIGRRLKALREDLGVPQKQVAELAGMKPPQLAKIEQGESDLRVSTVQALLSAMGADWSALAGDDVPEVSVKTVVRRAQKAGVDRSAGEQVAECVGRRGAARAISRAFGLNLDALLAGESLVPRAIAVPVKFKAVGISDPRRDPMLVAAEQISRAVARTIGLPTNRPDPRVLLGRLDVSSAGDALATLVEWAWDNHIPTVPLFGKGGFAAAIWQIEDTPVVLLKDSRALSVYWLFDLAHELGHLASGHVDAEGVVDVSEPSVGHSDDTQESEATAFALELLLPGHRNLIQEIRSRSSRDGRRLFKPTVADVARREKVDPALLGIVAAYELEDVARPQDRWGSAHNLATGPGGRQIVQRVMRDRLDLADVDPLDAAWIKALISGG